MKNIRSTRTLPENYLQIGQFDLNENRGLAMILNLAGIGVLFGVGWLLLESLAILRPEYLLDENILIITGMREFWRGVLLLVISVGLMVILNESGRWVMFWIITREKPTLGIRGFYSFAAVSTWYLTKGDYLFIRLLPMVGVTVAGLIAVPVVPLNLVPGVLLLIALNLAAGLGDVFTAYWLSRRPKDILIMDIGDGVQVFHHQGGKVSQGG